MTPQLGDDFPASEGLEGGWYRTSFERYLDMHLKTLVKELSVQGEFEPRHREAFTQMAVGR
ncbi:hypothetical protein [Janibacter indicus]|uniref:Uncharacterized protein n=1 Tax=Janibacter indicus TaxID=857417 RepID=A0A1W1Y4R7_9MICO|nr:hypothetical protein [Janibacter indicus]SMC31129.1 hypothetical protein SAMN06296429_1012 [Janibacter indicus]